MFLTESLEFHLSNSIVDRHGNSINKRMRTYARSGHSNGSTELETTLNNTDVVTVEFIDVMNRTPTTAQPCRFNLNGINVEVTGEALMHVDDILLENGEMIYHPLSAEKELDQLNGI